MRLKEEALLELSGSGADDIEFGLVTFLDNFKIAF